MALAEQFESLTASVLPSQDFEVTLRKQATLDDHRREVRVLISQMTPETTLALLGEYGPPTLETVAAIETTFIQRELAIENAAQEVNLDKDWLTGNGNLAARRMSEVGLSADDDWNIPEM
jgi:hypothetical protein